MNTVQRRSGPLAALLLGCAACFNPDGGGGSGSSTSAATTTVPATTAPDESTSDPTPTTSLPDPPETTSGATSGASTSTSTTLDPMTTSATDDTTDDGTTGPDLCGNGAIDPGEGCDPGILMDVVSCTNCKRSGRFVFVTNEMMVGADVGVGEGMALCNQVGPQFEGIPSITYTVWLSEANDSAPVRIAEADLPFMRIDGTIVAATRDDFVMGPHVAPISITQSNTEIGSGVTDCTDMTTLVWTGTAASGEWATETCTNWSVDDPMIHGALGLLHQSTSDWTAACTLPCDTPARLYCVENP